MSSTTIILTHHSILSLHMVWGVSHLWRFWFPTHTPHLCLVYPTGVSDHPRPRTGIPVTLLPPGVVHSVRLWRLWDSGPRNNSLSLWDSDPRGMSPLIWDSDPSTILGFWAQVHALYHHCQLISDSELTSRFYQFYEYAWSNWAFALPACALIADSCLWVWSLTWLLWGSAPCDNSKPLSPLWRFPEASLIIKWYCLYYRTPPFFLLSNHIQ